MRVVISVIRPFHFTPLANALSRDHHEVRIYSGAPRKFFKGLTDDVRNHLVPAPLAVLSRLFHKKFSPEMNLKEAVFWDKSVAALVGAPAIAIGLATVSLHTGRKVKRNGGRYILDRACPHVDFQQNLIREESEKLGAPYTPPPAWFRQRLLAEYEEADAILVPSEYTARSFPDYQRNKLIKAPLTGRGVIPEIVNRERNSIFTVGIVGGELRRKGYLYLLRAWKRLALPNAKLLIRCSADFSQFPVLDRLLKELTNVEIVHYVPDMKDFYSRCDAFVLPSVDDGFGMALFEAMGHGVPCIVTRNCGASELLANGEDGIIIDARNEDQIADGILKLYEDEDLRRSIGSKGRETAIHITSGGGAHLYEQAVQQILRGHSAQSCTVPVS